MTSRHYRGGCQCGAIAYEVEVDLDEAIACNCSRCRPLGAILVFTSRAGFELRSGADCLTEYRFNNRHIAHLFCRTCGIESFAEGTGPDGSPVVAINVNCLEGVDPRSLTPMQVDGRSL